jgi:hypothetical protein
MENSRKFDFEFLGGIIPVFKDEQHLLLEASSNRLNATINAIHLFSFITINQGWIGRAGIEYRTS